MENVDKQFRHTERVALEVNFSGKNTPIDVHLVCPSLDPLSLTWSQKAFFYSSLEKDEVIFPTHYTVFCFRILLCLPQSASNPPARSLPVSNISAHSSIGHIMYNIATDQTILTKTEDINKREPLGPNVRAFSRPVKASLRQRTDRRTLQNETA